MKKIILIFFLIIITVSTLGQSANAMQSAQMSQYCILVVRGAYLNYANISLDYGQSSKGEGDTDPLLQTINERLKKIDSVVTALNYLNSQGWECIGVVNVPSSQTPAGTFDSQIQYLLRRR